MKKTLALLALGLLLSGCAASPRRLTPKIAAPRILPVVAAISEPAAESTAPPAELPSRVSSPKPEDPNVKLIEELMDRASSLFDEGERRLRLGQIDEGKRLLRQAADLIAGSPFSRFQYPQLAVFDLNLQRSVTALEADFWEEPEGPSVSAAEDKSEQQLEPAAVDALPDINLFQATVDPSLVSLVTEHVRNSQFAIPVVFHDRVFRMLEYYQTRLRGIMEHGLAQSGKYLPLFRSVFEEEGVPVELVHVAQVESLYQPLAYSRARAKGIWQFTRPAAKDYLLKMTRWVDERSDIEKSTRAAARYLKELYGKFGDWHIALAAYNCGPGRLERLQARHGSLTYWEMADRGLLPAETANYVPSVLATLLIANNPQRYGFQAGYAQPLEFEKVGVGRSVRLSSIASALGVELQTLKELNPELTRMVTPRDYADYQLKVPLGVAQELTEELALLPDASASASRRYRVGRGDTLAGVARKLGVPAAALARANKLAVKAPLKQNMVLTVPANEVEPVPLPRRALAARYRVRRGDTLTGISRKTGAGISRLKELNGLDARSVLRVGQVLVMSPAKSTATA
ncbi:MAG: transglycosylase SLT domain-containing protein, partial [Acidobacteria bacterium]|nr:transglycosylase SLT domain-containing protein [Acidobacteriota bacterium]